MFGAIAGDIIGSRFEGKPTPDYQFDLFHKDSKPTDDTILITSVMKKVLEGGTYQDRLREGYRSRPDAGFGLHFQLWAVTGSPHPYRSYGNGAAVRACPLGLVYPILHDTLDAARASAIVTHDTDQAVAGAMAIAGSVFLARTGESKEMIWRFLEHNFPWYKVGLPLDDYGPASRGVGSCDATVPAAIAAFLRAENYEDCIRKAVSIGGDTDTIAAMAGALAEAYYGKIDGRILSVVKQKLDDADLLDIVERFYQRFPLDSEEREISQMASAFPGAEEPKVVIDSGEGAVADPDDEDALNDTEDEDVFDHPDDSESSLDKKRFEADLEAFFVNEVYKSENGRILGPIKKDSKNCQGSDPPIPGGDFDDNIGEAYPCAILVKYLWYDGAPISWDQSLHIFSVRPRVHYIYLMGDVYMADESQVRIAARIEGKLTLGFLREVFRTLLHNNGRDFCIDLFGYLPTETENYVPVSLPADFVREAYHDWMNAEEKGPFPQSWSVLMEGDERKIYEDDSLDLTFYDTAELRQRAKEGDRWTTGVTLQNLKEQTLLPADKRRIVDNYFDKTYRESKEPDPIADRTYFHSRY